MHFSEKRPVPSSDYKLAHPYVELDWVLGIMVIDKTGRGHFLNCPVHDIPDNANGLQVETSKVKLRRMGKALYIKGPADTFYRLCRIP